MHSSPLHLLHRASQVAELLWRQARVSVTPRQLAVLITVAEEEGLCQIDVTERTGIDRMTTADVIRRLVAQGLLQRRRSRRDTRAYVLKLTDEGQNLLARAEPMALRADSALLRSLPPERRGPFMAALRAIVRSLEATR